MKLKIGELFKFGGEEFRGYVETDVDRDFAAAVDRRLGKNNPHVHFYRLARLDTPPLFATLDTSYYKINPQKICIWNPEVFSGNPSAIARWQELPHVVGKGKLLFTQNNLPGVFLQIRVYWLYPSPYNEGQTTLDITQVAGAACGHQLNKKGWMLVPSLIGISGLALKLERLKAFRNPEKFYSLGKNFHYLVVGEDT